MKRARDETKEFLDLVCNSIKSSTSSSSTSKSTEDEVRLIISNALKSLDGEVGDRIRALVQKDFDSNVRYLTDALNSGEKTSTQKVKKTKTKKAISLESSDDFENVVTRTGVEARKIANLTSIPSCMWIHTKLEQMGKTRPSQITVSNILDCFRDDASGCREVSGLALYAERFRHYFGLETKRAVQKNNMSSLRDLQTCCESFLSILALRVISNVPASLNSGGMYVPNAADWRAAVENMSTSRKQLAKAAFGSVSQDWRSDIAYVLSNYIWIRACIVFLETDVKKRKTMRKTWFQGLERTILAVLETSVHIGYVSSYLCDILEEYMQESKSDTNLETVWSTLFSFFISLENMIGRIPRDNVKSDGLRYLLRLIVLRRTRDVFQSRFRDSLKKKTLRKTLRWIQETQNTYLSLACPQSLIKWLSNALNGEARGISKRTASSFESLVRKNDEENNSFDAGVIFESNSLSLQQLDALVQLYTGHCFGGSLDDEVNENEEDEDEKEEDDKPMFFIDSVGSERARAQSRLLRSAGNHENRSSSWHDSTQRLMEELSDDGGEDEED